MRPPLRKRSRKSLMELKPHLDAICSRVESPEFIQNDPVLFMHAFENKRDREVAGFIAALFAWGQRSVVLQKTEKLIKLMEFDPFQFIHDYHPGRAAVFADFRHRTFNQSDLHGLFSALRRVYEEWSDFEAFWHDCLLDAANDNRHLFTHFRRRFSSLSEDLLPRTLRHIPDPERQSGCKRISMFLRWCNRKKSPVDPGIWNLIPPSQLPVPMDVHVARESRRLGLLSRRSNDWKAVRELTESLRQLDPKDPIKYDFALFGLGALDYRIPSRFLLNRQP